MAVAQLVLVRSSRAPMGILSRFFGKPLKSEVENCIRAAGMVIVVRLARRYGSQYGDESAFALASAVTNELFGAPPGNEIGRQFLASNKQLVETQLHGWRANRRFARSSVC